MSNEQIAALLLSMSAIILSCGAMHMRYMARRKSLGGLAAAPATPVALIQPLPVVRDADGWWWHPDLPNFEDDHQGYSEWMLSQGLEYRFHSLESEDSDHPAAVAYYDNSACHVREWSCELPTGEGWFVLSIHDSEDGPQWVWARRVGTQVLMERIHAEALTYHQRYYAAQLPGGQRYSGSQFKPNGSPILLRGSGARSVFCDLDE